MTTEASDEESHVLAADGKETVTAEWLTAGEALKRAFDQSAHLMPPQVMSLSDLPKDIGAFLYSLMLRSLMIAQQL